MVALGLDASRARNEEDGVSAMPDTATTSDAARRRGSAQPRGLRRSHHLRHPANGGDSALPNPALRAEQQVVGGSQRGHVLMMLGTL